MAWRLSTFTDLAQPHVNGPYPPGYRVARWLSNRFIRASITDPDVNRIYLDVVHMRAHPRVLSHPATMVKVARALHRQRLASRQAAASVR